MKILKFIIAHSTYKRVWRVTYQDGRNTYPLSYNEAKPLSEIFKGKLWIDYDNGIW